MWSIGVYDYGLTSEEFWRTTPGQFHAIGKRFDSSIKRSDLGFGIVSSVIANCNRDPKKKKKPYEPKDFMPVYEKKRKMSQLELKSYWDSHVIPSLSAQQRALKKQREARNG